MVDIHKYGHNPLKNGRLGYRRKTECRAQPHLERHGSKGVR